MINLETDNVRAKEKPKKQMGNGHQIKSPPTTHHLLPTNNHTTPTTLHSPQTSTTHHPPSITNHPLTTNHPNQPPTTHQYNHPYCYCYYLPPFPPFVAHIKKNAVKKADHHYKQLKQSEICDQDGFFCVKVLSSIISKLHGSHFYNNMTTKSW